MLKALAVGATAFVVTSASLAFAQSSPATVSERLSAVDRQSLIDLRVNLVKAALQLTPEQAQYWPAVESAIRSRVKNRQARVDQIVETVGRRMSENPVEVVRDRDPISFLNRRADALAQRSDDLKKLASAWQPLYQSLSQEQKRHMAALAIFVLRDMTDGDERRLLQLGEN
jgi:hypothetical protein